MQFNFTSKIIYTGLDILLISKDLSISPYYDTQFYFYNASKDYPCVGCTACFNTYQLNLAGDTCIKAINVSSNSSSQSNIMQNTSNI